jgi:hypothetical protein
MANKLNNVLFQRLQDRAHIISTTPNEDMPRLEYILAQAQYLGKLLHTARQLFEKPTFTPASLDNRREESMTMSFPTEETLWLWEQGLMLPDEVTSGQVSAVVRSYVDCLYQQRGPDPAYRLKQDIVSLYSALKEGHAMSDHYSLEVRDEH